MHEVAIHAASGGISTVQAILAIFGIACVVIGAWHTMRSTR